jgi:hypothetical protein
VLLAIERANFAMGRREAMASTANRALLKAKSFVNLAAEDGPLVSTVKIDVLDLVVLTEFNISAWNIKSSDVAVTVFVANTVSVTVAVLSEVRSVGSVSRTLDAGNRF